MSWKRRILEIVLAGGTLAGCSDTVVNTDMAIQDMSGGDMTFSFTCNANPDPCCANPQLPQCPKDGGHD